MHIGRYVYSLCMRSGWRGSVSMERKCVDRTSLALSTIPHDYDVTWNLTREVLRVLNTPIDIA